MKLITKFKETIWTYNLKKWEDPVIFGEIQKAIALAFDLPNVEDTFDNLYNYVVSIDMENNEIVSGYRHILCKNAHIGKVFNLNTFKYYDFSDKFSTDYADRTLELGRSFVNPSAKKKLWGLFSIWEGGLGPLINYQTNHNGINYILGQVSLKESIYDSESIKAILKMFWINFGTHELLSPRQPTFSQSELESFNICSDLEFSGKYSNDKVMLTKFLKKKNQPRPTLFLNYADIIDGNKDGLSCFLPIHNSLLKCYEMGFLLRIDKMSTACVERYLQACYDSAAFTEETTVKSWTEHRLAFFKK